MSKKFPKAVLTLIILLIAASGNAQSFVEGVVANKSNEELVPFATIAVKNKSRGTISNAEGKFRLDTRGLEDNDTIQISHVSYATFQLTLGKLKTDQGKITLTENAITLKEVSVYASKDDRAFLDEIINQSKKNTVLPTTYDVYYREWVRENASYNRFADGLLTVAYPVNKEDVKVQVKQSRAFKLPKDEDDMFEMGNPVKLEYVLAGVYINFLNRFRGDNKDNYRVDLYQGSAFDDFNTLIITPKLGVKDSSKLFKAIVKADQNMNIRTVEIKTDSLYMVERSLLGFHMKILTGTITLNFKNNNGHNYLAYARMEFKLKFTFKKMEQIDTYTSEFILLNAVDQLTEIARKDEYKKALLYKSGNKFTTNFWEGLEMPLLSDTEKKLIESLAEKSAVINKPN